MIDIHIGLPIPLAASHVEPAFARAAALDTLNDRAHGGVHLGRQVVAVVVRKGHGPDRRVHETQRRPRAHVVGRERIGHQIGTGRHSGIIEHVNFLVPARTEVPVTKSVGPEDGLAGGGIDATVFVLWPPPLAPRII